MKIKISGKKFVHVSDEFLTRAQTEQISIELPRYYNNQDLKGATFVIKVVNSDGIYIEYPVCVTEYGATKIYLKWNASPIVTACDGQIGFQLLAQSADKTVLYQSFVGYAIVNNGIIASDRKNFSKDTLEEYLKEFRKIYSKAKTVESALPKKLITKEDFDAALEDKAEKRDLEQYAKVEAVYQKKDAEKIFLKKTEPLEKAVTCEKIAGVDVAARSSYYGKDETGIIGFHRLHVSDTPSAGVNPDLYYDKEQVDSLLSHKCDETKVYSVLEKKADKAQVYTKQDCNALLASKVDACQVYQKELVDQKLDAKADLVGGVIPTEQLPPLGFGEREPNTSSFYFPSKESNTLLGQDSLILGKKNTSFGNSCICMGEHAVAVAGATYGFVDFDEKTFYITLDEDFSNQDVISIVPGQKAVLMQDDGSYVIATILDKKSSSIQVDKAPPKYCTKVYIERDTGLCAVTLGKDSSSCGNAPISIGMAASAVSDFSVAIGCSTQARGADSVSLGNGCTTMLPCSVSIGSTCYSEQGVSIGDSCDSSKLGSVGIGQYCYAQEEGAVALGKSNNAFGKYSFCCGASNTAQYGETVVGLCAVPSLNETGAFHADSQAFVVGASHDTVTPANAFRVDFNGNIYGGAFHNTGADYAELFEWQDKNTTGEDRVGRFVTLKQDKISLAENEDLVLGVISGSAGVIGNNPMEWHNKYQRDGFGRLLYAQDPTTKEKNLVLNSSWNPKQSYQQRNLRPEWGCVGMLGRIRVEDNGECQAGTYCMAGKSEGKTGVAVPALINAKQKWYITKRISKNIIEILFTHS